MAGDSIHVLFGDSSDCKGYLIDSVGILQHCRCIFSAVSLQLLMPFQVPHLFNHLLYYTFKWVMPTSRALQDSLREWIGETKTQAGKTKKK